MARYICTAILGFSLGLLLPSYSAALTNPDQISVYFPALEGAGNLGRNVSTVLSLQLAQTTRRMPWPDNPENHDFGEGMIRYSTETLREPSHVSAVEAAQNRNLRAQMVIWGRTFKYGGDVLAEVNVTLPKYRTAPSRGCRSTDLIKCDYRQENFEIWRVSRNGHDFLVDIPRRQFGVSTIVLRQEVVDNFEKAEGLIMRDKIKNGTEVGVTGPDLRFIEFNKKLPGAPTLVRSKGVEGYISLPEISNQVSEYADLIGGILQVFRGDWELAIKSFNDVLENPKTRIMTRVDSLLYRGMAKMRLGHDGRSDFDMASELAPYDHVVARYQVTAAIASDAGKNEIQRLIDDKAFLFAKNDPWYREVRNWINSN